MGELSVWFIFTISVVDIGVGDYQNTAVTLFHNVCFVNLNL